MLLKLVFVCLIFSLVEVEGNDREAYYPNTIPVFFLNPGGHIYIQQPYKNQVCAPGFPITVSWQTVGLPSGRTVAVSLLLDGSRLVSLGSSPPLSAQSIEINLPSNLEARSTYSIQLQSDGVIATSQPFSVARSAANLLLPNRASLWRKGQVVELNWNSLNFSPSARFTFTLVVGNSKFQIGSALASSRTLNYFLPTNVPETVDAIVTIEFDGSIVASSPKFVIVSASSLDCGDEVIATRLMDEAYDPLYVGKQYNVCGLWSTKAAIDVGTHHMAILLSSDESKIALLYRGTDATISDWVNNFKFIPVSCAEKITQCRGTIHTGFLDEYLAVRDLTLQVLSGLNLIKISRILVTGHSQGGAVATLASFDLAKTFPCHAPKIKLITFGSPKVGSSDFVNLFKSTVPMSIRYVTKSNILGDDIVTTLGIGVNHVDLRSTIPCDKLLKRDAMVSISCHMGGEYTKGIVLQGRGRNVLVGLSPVPLPANCLVSPTSPSNPRSPTATPSNRPTPTSTVPVSSPEPTPSNRSPTMTSPTSVPTSTRSPSPPTMTTPTSAPTSTRSPSSSSATSAPPPTLTPTSNSNGSSPSSPPVPLPSPDLPSSSDRQKGVDKTAESGTLEGGFIALIIIAIVALIIIVAIVLVILVRRGVISRSGSGLSDYVFFVTEDAA